MTQIADGRAETATRLKAVLGCDTGLGILRYADAGYETAEAAAVRHRLDRL